MSAVNAAFVILVLLFVKHWYIDFVNQSDAEVRTKGIYGKFPGVLHSIKHGIVTAIIVYLIGEWEFDLSVVDAMIIGSVDAIVHYHCDWLKMRYGNRDITSRAFWAHLGLDQLVHSLTYVGIVWILV